MFTKMRVKHDRLSCEWYYQNINMSLRLILSFECKFMARTNTPFGDHEFAIRDLHFVAMLHLAFAK